MHVQATVGRLRKVAGKTAVSDSELRPETPLWLVGLGALSRKRQCTEWVAFRNSERTEVVVYSGSGMRREREVETARCFCS